MEILLRQILTILHLLGTALGAGGAFISDIVFLKSVKDKKVDGIEFSFLKLMSSIVWLGVSLLIVSGAGLFWISAERLMVSPKFWAKMSIVLIILINGALFHYLHIPLIGKARNTKLFFELGTRESTTLILSGVISVSSWVSALILGSWRNVPFSYVQILSIYTGIIALGSFMAPLVLKKILTPETVKSLFKISAGLLVIAGILLVVVF